MNLKTISLTAFFSIGFIFPSCDWATDDCGNLDPVPAYFDIEGMRLLNYKVKDEYDCCGRDLLDSAAVVSADFFRLVINFDVSYFGQTERPVHDGFGIMNSALSCSPDEPGFKGSQEQIESLTVVTLTNWDSLHVAGDTINDQFYVYNLGNRSHLDEFLETNISYIKEEQIGLQLKGASDTNSEFQARVLLRLRNGEEYTAESELVHVVR